MSRLTGLLTAVTATVALVAGLAQALAYLAAQAFYRQLGLLPSDLGVTPINAAFRMSGTFRTLLIQIVLNYTILLLVLVCAISALVLNWLHAATDSERWRRANQALVSPTQHGLGRLDRWSRWTLSLRRGTALDLQRRYANFRKSSSYTWPLWVPLIALLIGLIFVNQQYSIRVSAQRALSALARGSDYIRHTNDEEDGYNVDVANGIIEDLGLQNAQIEWLDKTRIPPSLASALTAQGAVVDRQRFLYIGIVGDKYAIYDRSTGSTLLVRSIDVALRLGLN